VQIAGIAGALLERKRYSVATHYRNVDESDVIEVERAVIEVAARHRELRARSIMRKFNELQPDLDWDKGGAYFHQPVLKNGIS